MALYDIRPKLGSFGPRGALLRIHRDLFAVHKKIRRWAEYYPPELTNLEKIVLALEDRRFMKHIGIDWRSLVREIGRATLFTRHGGASTIDMQFVRTATGYKKYSVVRKMYEMLLAVLIQYRYSKIVILRSYLSCAFFGSGLVGAERASRRVFRTGHDDLTLEQGALLAAMLVYPRPLKEGQGWEARVRRRANYGIRIYVAGKKSFDKFPS